jgi:phage recombination protein Bet
MATLPVQKAAPAPAPATALTELPQRRLVQIVAEKYNIEPAKLLPVLKNTCFKDATDEQMVALLVVSNEYNLNPFTREIYAFPARNGGIVPVVGIDGWLRIINEHVDFDGMEIKESEDGKFCTVTIYNKKRKYPTIITEYFEEVSRATDPWKSHPRRMLRHKAIIQCARVAFAFTGIKDEDEAEVITAAEVIDTKPLPKMPQEKKEDAPAPETQAPAAAGPQQEMPLREPGQDD